MERSQVITGVLMDDDTYEISFSQACETYHIPEAFLIELWEHGFFNEFSSPIHTIHLNLQMIKRIHAARRLQEDLGINLAGVVLAMELVDELENLRDEVKILRHHIK